MLVGWGHSLLTEHLPRMCRALGWIPNTMINIKDVLENLGLEARCASH